MQINKAEFWGSSAFYTKCPEDNRPEFAFIGRSNVGKSSLINMLLNKKNIARVSKVPGKTQLINHFMIDNSWFLVDLPGYGWAKVSKGEKNKWQKMTKEYLTHRKQLLALFILIDSKILPQKIDLDFINWIQNYNGALNMVFTKIDKISNMQVEKNIDLFKQTLYKSTPKVKYNLFTASSKRRKGKVEILDHLNTLISSTKTNYI